MRRGMAQEGALLRVKTDRVVSEIVNIVSHEMRTPVAVIAGASEGLGKTAGNGGGENSQRLIANIQKHTKRLTGILDDIAHLYGRGERSATVTKTPVPLAGLLEGIVAELRSGAQARGVAIEL